MSNPAQVHEPLGSDAGSSGGNTETGASTVDPSRARFGTLVVRTMVELGLARLKPWPDPKGLRWRSNNNQ